MWHPTWFNYLYFIYLFESGSRVLQEIVTYFEQNASSRTNNYWLTLLVDVENLNNHVVEMLERIFFFLKNTKSHLYLSFWDFNFSNITCRQSSS